MALVAESISLGKMIKLQEQSALISDVLREWQDRKNHGIARGPDVE